MSEYKERDLSWAVKDPLLHFVLDGVRHAVANNTVTSRHSNGEPWTWEDARDKIAGWYPTLDKHFLAAEIIVPELDDGA